VHVPTAGPQHSFPKQLVTNRCHCAISGKQSVVYVRVMDHLLIGYCTNYLTRESILNMFEACSHRQSALPADVTSGQFLEVTSRRVVCTHYRPLLTVCQLRLQSSGI
jgi:hypothetical protein